MMRRVGDKPCTREAVGWGHVDSPVRRVFCEARSVSAMNRPSFLVRIVVCYLLLVSTRTPPQYIIDFYLHLRGEYEGTRLGVF